MNINCSSKVLFFGKHYCTLFIENFKLVAPACKLKIVVKNNYCTIMKNNYSTLLLRINYSITY